MFRKHYKKQILTLATVTLIFLHLLPLPSLSENDRVVKIGVLTDLTGKAAYLGQQTRVAAELLQQELNANGKKVEFVLSDHGLDTAKAVTEAQKLIFIDKVDAIFSNFSGTSRAVSPIVKNANKLFVYTAAAVEPVTNNPNSFKSYLDYVLGCQKIAAAWKKQGIKVIAVLKAEAEFGELCLEGAAIEYSDLIVVSYKPGDKVDSQVLSLKAKKVEAILNAGYEGDMENMLKAMRQLKFSASVGANEDIYTERLIKEYAPELQLALAFGMPRLSPEFISQAKNLDSKNLAGTLDQLGMSYLHLKQEYEALIACPQDDITCAAKHFQQSPADIRFGFLGWRNNRQADYNWTLSTFQEGRFEVIN